MANSKGPSNIRNSIMYNGKHSFLPPKSPFPILVPSYLDYVSSPAIRGKGMAKFGEGNPHHQRTSSESTLIEDQPSWLDELLNEPETPIHRGHRRSSSDSFAYMDVPNTARIDYVAQDKYRSRNMASVPSRSCQDFDYCKDVNHASLYPDVNPLGKIKNRAWDLPPNALAHSKGLLSGKDNFVLQNSASSFASQQTDRFPSNTTDKQNPVECGSYDAKASSEVVDSSYAKVSASETDTKHAKQQFAQRSRVRKLQYIAELERNVQALQAEGSEVSAEIEFLNQQNLILSMENKALKQRLENIAQEQVIKYLEHEVLEREMGRLRALHQQQPQPLQQLPSSRHRRATSRETNGTDLHPQLASLSLKQESSSVCDVSSPLHI